MFGYPTGTRGVALFEYPDLPTSLSTLFQNVVTKMVEVCMFVLPGLFEDRDVRVHIALLSFTVNSVHHVWSKRIRGCTR